MKNILILLAVMAAIGCGSDNSVEGLKTQLAEKKKAMSTLKLEIEALEKTIAETDSSAVKDLRTAVKLEVIAPGELKNPFQLQGLVASDRNVMVSAEMGGTITRVFVKDGQVVSKGQTLATLDGSAMAAQMAELKKGYELAVTSFEKQEILWKQNFGTEMQFLQAKNRKESLEKSLATAQIQLGKFTLKAPISGVVDQLLKNEGEILGPGMPFARVVDASQIKIQADVSESYLQSIKKGDEVEIYYPSLKKKSMEKIFSVGNYIHPENRTFSVYILPSGNLQYLKPNLLALITAYDFVKSDVISVPTKLIRNDGNGDYVLTAKKGPNGKMSVVKTPVEIEEKFSARSVIKSGLVSGDLLIVEGYQSVISGDEIKEVK
jgi:RND family efflux transporter MFP subunit